jgi:3-oxoacyl-[acyl-carrier-protein] synthase-1
MQKVYVTGIGTVSAIGLNVEESYASLKTLRTGIKPIGLLDTRLKDTLPAGEIPFTDEELKQKTSLEDARPYSRTSLLAMLAAREAFQSAGINSGREAPTGLFNATSVGGMDKGEHFYKDYLRQHIGDSLRYALVHDCGDGTECIADHLEIRDYLTTISTACSSSANAVMQAARMINAGMLERAVAGGADALSLFTINGFNSLMILSDEYCRPFDGRRKGLNLGEGAGYLVLESEKSLMKSGKAPLAELTGYGNACDAFHQTASSADGQGAWLAMTKALETAGLKPAEVDYINVHGTGTVNNDLSEGTAIARIFGENVPPFSSTKSYTGHTLAAAGGIEAVFSVLALRHGVVFPNLHFGDPMPELRMQPATEWGAGRSIKHVLSNSFGFGGNNSSLLFSKC